MREKKKSGDFRGKGREWTFAHLVINGHDLIFRVKELDRGNGGHLGTPVRIDDLDHPGFLEVPEDDEALNVSADQAFIGGVNIQAGDCTLFQASLRVANDLAQVLVKIKHHHKPAGGADVDHVCHLKAPQGKREKSIAASVYLDDD